MYTLCALFPGSPRSRAIPPRLRTAKITAVAAATIPSVDNLIRLCVLKRRLQKEFLPSATGIKQNHAVSKEGVVLARRRANQRAPCGTQQFFHIKSMQPTPWHCGNLRKRERPTHSTFERVDLHAESNSGLVPEMHQPGILCKPLQGKDQVICKRS